MNAHNIHCVCISILQTNGKCLLTHSKIIFCLLLGFLSRGAVIENEILLCIGTYSDIVNNFTYLGMIFN